MRVPQTETFKGLMYPVIANGTGVSDGTKTYTKSSAPAVRGAEKVFDKATARIAPMPMAKEIDAFIRELSVGKKKFRHKETYLQTDRGEVIAIVSCSWYEKDLPIAPSAMPQQAIVSAIQEQEPAPFSD
ncbi:MAG: hypothetical protein AAB389_02680 [Patescibacteria group bacterium]